MNVVWKRRSFLFSRDPACPKKDLDFGCGCGEVSVNDVSVSEMDPLDELPEQATLSRPIRCTRVRATAPQAGAAEITAVRERRNES